MCEVIYKAVIPLDPKTKKNNLDIKFRSGSGSSNCLYKKTPYGLKAVGIPFITQGDRYKEYEKNCGYWLRKPQGGAINEPVNICFTFYRESKRVVDLCNLQNAILDVLTHYHIIADDNRNVVYSMDGSRVYYDKTNPRTEIVITRLENAKKWVRNRKEEKEEV